MTIFLAINAFFKGLLLCFGNSEIRRLAIKPWILASISYVPLCILALYLHEPILKLLVNSPEGLWSSTWYYLVYLGLWLMLLIGAFFLCMSVVMIFGGVYQTSIAIAVLKAQNIPVPKEDESIIGVLKETGRSARNEMLKLLWILPLSCTLFVIGLFPIFTPFAIACGAWLMGYQAIDITLDALRFRIRDRLSFSLSRMGTTAALGAPFLLAMTIPFMGLLLPPVAAAAAAWLISKEPLTAQSNTTKS